MALKKATDELTKITDELESEEMRHLNLEAPVMDEDGIVRDVPLLAGYVDKDGILHKTFSYREMNGKDEEAISKVDVRSNGAKIRDIVCERCVVAIGTLTKKEHHATWGSIIREMLGGDLDYMAFKIRELSKGSEVTFTHSCPRCGQKLTTIVNTSEFNIKPYLGVNPVAFTLERGFRDSKGVVHKDGTLRLPNGNDAEAITPIARKNASTALSALIARCMSFDDGTVVTQNLVQEMSLRDRGILEDIIKDNVFGIDTTLEGLQCESCGQMIEGQIGQSDFF